MKATLNDQDFKFKKPAEFYGDQPSSGLRLGALNFLQEFGNLIGFNKQVTMQPGVQALTLCDDDVIARDKARDP